MTIRTTYRRPAAAPATGPSGREHLPPQLSPWLRAVLGFLALFLVSAFGPAPEPIDAPLTADAPIAAHFVAAADIALEGHWRGTFASDRAQPQAATISITRTAARGQYIVTINSISGSREYAAHTSALRGLKFLNIRLTRQNAGQISGKAGERTRYVLALYSISGSGALSLRTIPAELARQAVLSGRLSGRYWAADEQTAPELRGADSVTLRRFLRQIGPARVFSGQWGRFRRVAPSTTIPANTLAAIASASGDQSTGTVTRTATSSTRR